MNVEGLACSILSLAGTLLEEAPQAESQPVPALAPPFSNTTQADWAEAVKLWNEHGRRLISGLETRACPACGQNSCRRLFESYDGYPFVECHTCGSWYVPLVVNAALFEEFFSRCPEAEDIALRSFSKRKSAENTAADLQRIGSYLDILLPLLPPGLQKKYLDVGCGIGHSLTAARNRGLKAAGIESSRRCVAIGRNAGMPIRHVDELPTGLFDLVSFWESLEHMADPAATLVNCHALLNERGLLAFTVPNQASPLVRVLRSDCSVVNGGCDTPGHINLFGASSINTLLDRCGFTLLGLDGQYGLSLPELLSYMGGNTRGAHDMLSGQPVDSGMSSVATAITKGIGPAVTVLERVALASPILFGFACKKGSDAAFAGAVRDFQSRRKTAILEQIALMMPQ